MGEVELERKQHYALTKNKFLSDQEFDHLMSVLKRHLSRDPRNCLLMQVALFTGARAREILNLKVRDLDQAEKSLFIHGVKGSANRELPLANELFNELAKLCSGRSSTDLLFGISYPRLHQIWDVYRPVAKPFHCLRHTFAIRLYKKTKDIRLLQLALGHRNIANTMIYADYVYSQQELRRIIL